MKKICIFTKYSNNGPSSKYRILIYLNDLSKKYDLKCFNFWNEKFYKDYSRNKRKYIINIFFLYIYNYIKRIFQIYFYARKCDVVIFQKGVIPYSFYNPIKMLKKCGCKVIIDIDDSIYLQKRDNSCELSKYADMIICGNDNLREYYMSFNNNVVKLPTVDYSPMYKKFLKNTFCKKEIVWIGTPATIDNLDLIIKPFNRIVDEYPDVRFKIICSSDFGYTNKIKNSYLAKWSEESYINDMSSASIGIMPLKDNDYNRGKCGFKIIQYFNLEKPAIVSNVGVNSEIVEDCGFVSENEEDWYFNMKKLLFDESIYNKCIDGIRMNFYKKYGYETNFEKLVNFIESQQEGEYNE